MGRKAGKIRFLHAGSNGHFFKQGDVVGKYVIRYEDGTSHETPIRNRIEIGDFNWGEAQRAPVAWIGGNPARDELFLYRYALENPHPEKVISSLELSSEGTVHILTVAITLED